jgi:hypothetical protein
MIGRIWHWLFHRCDHRWEIIKKIRVYEGEGDRLPICDKFVMRCTVCGDIKVRKV